MSTEINEDLLQEVRIFFSQWYGLVTSSESEIIRISTGFCNAFKEFFPNEQLSLWTDQLSIRNQINLYSDKRGLLFEPTAFLYSELSTEDRKLLRKIRTHLNEFLGKAGVMMEWKPDNSAMLNP